MTRLLVVDIDNTIADYTGALREYVWASGRDDCPCPNPVCYEFDRAPGWPFTGDPMAFRRWHGMAVADGLYSRERIVPGVCAALAAARDNGWRVVVATSRVDDRQGATQRWLEHHEVPYDGLYFGDKLLLQPTVLVDDNPDTIRLAVKAGVNVWHPDHAYCKDIPGSTGFRAWNEVPELLEESR